MSNDKGRNLADAEAALFEADQELGRRAFELAIAPRFPGYTQLVFTGADRYEPHLIYRGDDAFLIVETEISDPGDKQNSIVQRELPDGRWVERGTREYLLAGLLAASQSQENNRSLIETVIAAVNENRVRYILVTVIIGGNDGKREVDSLEFGEFEL